MRARRGSYDLALLSRPDVATDLLPLVRDTSPRAAVVYDSVDVHFVRLRREEDITGRAGSLGWERMRDIEENLCAAADVTATVSGVDAEEFTAAFPGLEIDFQVLSNVLPPWRTAPIPPAASRSGALFIGGYRHLPNVDAIQWFAQDIWPLLADHHSLSVTLLGDSPPAEVRSLSATHGFHVPGFVADVTDAFDSARIFICPLRYGSGVKGKINQALSAGVPIVSTSVGAEGMGLRDGVDALIRDDAEGFASACHAIQEDDALWQRLSQGGRERAKQWDLPAMQTALEDLLQRLLPTRLSAHVSNR